mgnify:CR=1 FL=1
MSKFVVSANYRDRNSQYKWLVRRIDEPIEKAVACEIVNCSGVTFGDSNKEESGFGCNIVAYCENVNVRYAETTHDLPTDHIAITAPDESYNSYKFNGYAVCRTVPVESVEFLNLYDDGSMSAYGNSVDKQ